MNTLKFKSGINIGSDPIIFQLIKLFEIQWLFKGLWLLNGIWHVSFFLYVSEPLKLLCYLTIKTVFLFMMATAKWVSEHP